jgi:hypothetical protein
MSNAKQNIKTRISATLRNGTAALRTAVMGGMNFPAHVPSGTRLHGFARDERAA